jgi:hypothetical protein
MSGHMWKKLELEVVENPPNRIEATDSCYYARDYASGKNYTYSQANDLIHNFKKPVSTKGTPQWQYKLKAIETFAQELASWLKAIEFDFFVTAIPTSKHRNDPEYDPRFDLMLARLAVLCPRAKVVHPIIRTVSKVAAHLSGSNRPNVQEVYESLSWVNVLTTPPTILLLIDDVITAGTSFKACQQLITENAPNVNLHGVFWARTVWLDDPLSLPEIPSDLF